MRILNVVVCPQIMSDADFDAVLRGVKNWPFDCEWLVVRDPTATEMSFWWLPTGGVDAETINEQAWGFDA